MKCPVCSTIDLQLSVRQNIEIDYCPSCRGVWLDRGELDKIVERSMTDTTTGYRSEPHFASSYQSHHGGHHDDEHDFYVDPRTGKRKRKGGPLGFLGELFD
jgi:Zn-finger nucleic acid-binding protein